ncbi:MAG: GTP cyclohydrolase FolE2 [bacterium]
MKDIQNLPDRRNIDIQRVGIKNLHLPMFIRVKSGGYQSVFSNLSLSVDLPRRFKGTHLSRFVEILEMWSRKKISSREIRRILEETRTELKARQAQLTLRFKYFIEKKAPVSRRESVLDYGCEFTGILTDDDYTFILGVQVPVTALCPCSKAISKYGAHNQRGIVRVRIHYDGEIIWIEDLVRKIEEQASCQIYPLLKRSDEKYVTERAYENPKFVEDIMRDVILALRARTEITWFEVECEDFESIHNHSAFAYQREGDPGRFSGSLLGTEILPS